VKSPALWGSRAHLVTLFGSRASVTAQTRNFVFRYKSPEHWVEIFRSYYGPIVKAFAAIDPAARDALEVDLYSLLDELNLAEDGTLVVPSEYLEVVATKTVRSFHHRAGRALSRIRPKQEEILSTTPSQAPKRKTERGGKVPPRGFPTWSTTR
jgi:hypothetical protein